MNNLTGTSIQDLQRNEKMEQYENIRQLADMQQAKYGTFQDIQQKQAQYAMKDINHGARANSHYNMEEQINDPKWNTQHVPTMHPMQQMQQAQHTQQEQHTQTEMEDEADINDLVNDINNNLLGEEYNSAISEVELEHNENGGYLSFIPPMLREPLIILVIFLILSENVVKNTIGRYIPQINPDFSGSVSRTGVIVYGVLLAVLFIVFKKILL